MFYNITVTQAGDYQVVLHFAEPYWDVFFSGNGHGSRIFDMLVEGILLRDDMDVVQEVGPYQELVFSHRANVQDGVLTLEFDASANYPIINAIGVIEIDNSENQNPSPPTLSSSAITANSMDLNWSGAGDNIGATHYKIYKDGALETTVGDVVTHQVRGLTEATSYDFTVTAPDAAANESAVSNVEKVTTSTTGGASTVWNSSVSNINYTAGIVAIGASTLINYALAYGGKIIGEEVSVQLQINWPDYVFTEEYDLPTLEEVKQRITEKGYLINIPSAKEVEAGGIELGEMNRLLLENMEEVTCIPFNKMSASKNYRTKTNHYKTNYLNWKIK